METGSEEQVAMSLILNGGNAKKLAFDAIHEAKQGHFEAASQHLKAANVALAKGHQVQTDFLSQTISCDYQPSLLMVHAQDHLSMAMTTIDLGTEMVELYQQIISAEQ